MGVRVGNPPPIPKSSLAMLSKFTSSPTPLLNVCLLLLFLGTVLTFNLRDLSPPMGGESRLRGRSTSLLSWKLISCGMVPTYSRARKCVGVGVGKGGDADESGRQK